MPYTWAFEKPIGPQKLSKPPSFVETEDPLQEHATALWNLSWAVSNRNSFV